MNIRGEVEIADHEVLEVEELGNKCGENILNMNVEVKESEDKEE